ncbi:MAG TPA: DUF4922 domain-containing protein [Bacteroidales bacterium]|nr:DUF4922 domain-containing protein [Bacteroidales bacterium]HOS71024.1 DUF4922 domain-containing protein [Bacteroidales bacterium]HQH25231.1 DUF4922 domain-containing protein [Bacteroidales bacterium]HQJ82772.1 DUF4922 domain-containing protein [Bacteroidales bacterium]
MHSNTYSKRVSEFFLAQLGEWELAARNFRQLEKVKIRHLDFGGFEVLVQFNPERYRSTAAKTDSGSIEARPCFLCERNRPPQQRGLPFDDQFTVLLNPYPIIRRHLTIVSNSHVEQRIMNNFGKMLSIAAALPDYVVFYNGPQCGASAPDHLHFQAVSRGFMPLEKDFESQRFTHVVSTGPGYEILYWTGYLRGIVTLKGREKEILENLFESVYEKLSLLTVNRAGSGQGSELSLRDQPEHTTEFRSPGDDSRLPGTGNPADQSRNAEMEPMMNILVYRNTENLIVHIIPRKKHRPGQFFAAGSDKITISPASVDLGGLVITPREEDFDKLTENDISDIFRQVCVGEDELYRMLKG